jgi:hypothetical protein
VEEFQLLGVYLSVSVTSLFIWKLRHVVNICELQAVSCLESVKVKRYAESCYRGCLGLSDARLSLPVVGGRVV